MKWHGPFEFVPMMGPISTPDRFTKPSANERVHRYPINKMTSPRDLKVAIIGGGMCGLACAVGLVRAGIPVEIFEAAVCSRI